MAAYILNNIVYNVSGMRIAVYLFFYLTNGVDNSRMISSAKGLTDLHHGKVGDLPHDIHGDLSCPGNIGVSLLRKDILRGDVPVGSGNLLYNAFYRDGGWLAVVDDIADGRLGCGDIDRLVL